MTPNAKAALGATLARFPKARPPLPPRMREIYAGQYKENRAGGSAASAAAQRVEGWMHRRVAADVANGRAAATLEIGAGTLNHLAFEPASRPYDIVEPFAALFEDAPALGRVRQAFADLREAPPDRRYERIVSIAALEHVCDLPFVIARSIRLLAPGGVFRAAIPAEGGLLWRLGWMATTGLEFRLRHGLDYGVMMRHEHVNTAAEIELLIRCAFARMKVRSFGVGRQFSLYRFIEAREPRLEVAGEWEARFQATTG